MDIQGIFGDLNTIGIGGYSLDVRISENTTFTSDVPDSFIEDGGTVNDHIINRPNQISIDGEVSNIHIKKESIAQKVDDFIDKANDIKNILYSTQKTDTMLQKAKKYSSRLSSVVDTVQSGDIFNLLNSKSSTPQNDFFNFIENLHNTKTLISIETPLKTYENMRITSISITRNNETDEALKYKLTAKEVRFADTLLVDKNKYFKKPTKSVENKVKKSSNKGVVNGTNKDSSETVKSKTDETEKSFLYTLLE